MLLFLLLVRRWRRRQRAASRTNWCRPWLARRFQQGVFYNLVKEIDAEDSEQFRLFHRLDRQSYESILAMVYIYIRKQNTIMLAWSHSRHNRHVCALYACVVVTECAREACVPRTRWDFFLAHTKNSNMWEFCLTATWDKILTKMTPHTARFSPWASGARQRKNAFRKGLILSLRH